MDQVDTRPPFLTVQTDTAHTRITSWSEALLAQGTIARVEARRGHPGSSVFESCSPRRAVLVPVVHLRRHTTLYAMRGRILAWPA